MDQEHEHGQQPLNSVSHCIHYLQYEILGQRKTDPSGADSVIIYQVGIPVEQKSQVIGTSPGRGNDALLNQRSTSCTKCATNATNINLRLQIPYLLSRGSRISEDIQSVSGKGWFNGIPRIGVSQPSAPRCGQSRDGYGDARG